MNFEKSEHPRFAVLACVSFVGLCSPLAAQELIEEKVPSWESAVDFGLSASRGNSDNMLFRFGVETAKKNDIDAYYGSVSYKYGEEKGTANEDEILAKATWKHIIAGKNFFGLRMDARRDSFADIDYRVSFNATYGYYLIDTDKTVFSAEAGLGMTFEDLGLGADSYLNGLIEQQFSHKFNDHAKVYQSISYSPRLDHLEDYRIEFEAGLETKITKTVSFKFGLENRYASLPALGKKNNDLKLFSSLSYKF